VRLGYAFSDLLIPTYQFDKLKRQKYFNDCTTAHPTTMNVVYLKGPIMGGGFGLHESLTM
jgi:hypothetical protein